MTKKLFLLVPLLLCMVALPALAASVRILADRTPLRAAPDPSARVVLELRAGATLDLVDVSRDWYKVRDPQTGTEGYVEVSAADLQPGSAVPAPQAGAAPPATAAAAVRPKPSPKPGGWADAGYLSANGLYQAGGSAFTQTLTWPYFAETANATIQYPTKNAPGFDLAGGYRVWRNLAVGAGVSVVSRSVSATVTGTLPSPLYLNQPRTLTGGFSASTTELGIHIQAAWAVPVAPRLLLLLFGGPSIYDVQQTLVPGAVGIQYTDVYPYDNPTVSSTNSATSSKTAIGFGAGADFAYYITRAIGIGGMVRFARASVTFPAVGQSNAVSFDAGGVQAGVGVRVRFGGPPPARKAAPAPRK
jgi:hypothetical protein